MRPDIEHLVLYLSNRCNLVCRYCYVAVTSGKCVMLSYAQVKRAVDYFFEMFVANGGNVSARALEVSFLGGEPFLHFPVVKKAIKYIREQRGWESGIQIFTNGTLITPQKLNFLHSHRVRTTISLDGSKELNDANRVFGKNSQRSVFEEVVDRLKISSFRGVEANPVFNSSNVERLLQTIDLFYKMGFYQMVLDPRLYEIWPEERLHVLRNVLKGIGKYYAQTFEKGMPLLVFPIIQDAIEKDPKRRRGVPWWWQCSQINLGPDGYFYACEYAMGFPPGTLPQARIGSLSSGVDFNRRKKVHREARDFIEKHISGSCDYYFCPMGIYFSNIWAGRDPRPELEGFLRFSKVFMGGLLDIVKELQDIPAFRKLYLSQEEASEALFSARPGAGGNKHGNKAF